jgi:5,5'-dehydrodivanillate O-demethylase
VILMRRRMLEEAEAVARGAEPKALIRDPEQNACVRLPIIGRDYYVKGYPRVDGTKVRGGTPGVTLRHDFVFQAGQPEEVRQAYRKAMGLEPAP